MEEGYQPLPYVEGGPEMPTVKPPKAPNSGSGASNISSEKRMDLFAKARVIDALSNTLERNLRQGYSLRDNDVASATKSKLLEVINSLEV